MRKTLFVFLVAICIVLCGCHYNDKTIETEAGVITIDPDKLTVINNNGEFAAACLDTIHFLRLETSDDCLLGDITKIIESDSLIYILDELKGDAKRIFAFDRNGNFKRQISKIGQGPGEYIQLRTFDIRSDTLYMLDDYYNIIMRFDPNGRFIDQSNKIRLFNIEEMVILDSAPHVLVMTQLNSLNSIVHGVYSPFTDNEPIPVIENKFDRSKSFGTITCSTPVQKNDDGEIVMLQPFSPTALAFNPKTMQTREFVNIKCEAEIPVIGENENFSEFESKIDPKVRYSRFPYNVFQTGKWIIVNFFTGSIVFDIETSTGFYRPNMLESVDADIFPFATLSVVGKSSDGSLLGAMSAENFLNRVSEGSDNMKFMPPNDILDGLTEDANPVLIRYKFKE